jgi:hypothetical protein
LPETEAGTEKTEIPLGDETINLILICVEIS